MKAHRRAVSGRGSQLRFPVSAAGGGQLSCNSRAGQIKNPPSEYSGSNHGRHSYRMGPATTTTAASGRCREELLGQRPARRKCRPRHARMLGAATRGTKKEPTGALVAVLRTAALSRVVVPSVCFTPWGGVRIPLTTAPASLPCTPLFVAMRHLPPTGGSLCSLAAVSSAAIPVRVKLKTPLRIAAAATTVDIPSRWDPRANQSPTGALVAVLRTAALFDSRAGQIKNALAHCAKAFL